MMMMMMMIIISIIIHYTDCRGHTSIRDTSEIDTDSAGKGTGVKQMFSSKVV